MAVASKCVAMLDRCEASRFTVTGQLNRWDPDWIVGSMGVLGGVGTRPASCCVTEPSMCSCTHVV